MLNRVNGACKKRALLLVSIILLGVLKFRFSQCYVCQESHKPFTNVLSWKDKNCFLEQTNDPSRLWEPSKVGITLQNENNWKKEKERKISVWENFFQTSKNQHNFWTMSTDYSLSSFPFLGNFGSCLPIMALDTRKFYFVKLFNPHISLIFMWCFNNYINSCIWLYLNLWCYKQEKN